MGIIVKHILKHPSGGRTYRRAFPAELRPFVGRREYKAPSGLEGSPGFLSRYETANRAYEEQVALARRKLAGEYDTLDPKRLAYLGKAFELSLLEGAEHLLLKGRAETALNGWNWLLDDYKEWRRNQDVHAAEEHWGRSARALLDIEGLILNPSDRDAFGRLCLALNDAAITVGRDAKAILHGEIVPLPAAPVAPAERAAEPAAVPLLETFDAYAAAQGMTPGVRDEWRRAIQLLIAFTGHDDAARLTVANLQAWRDHLLNEPTRKGTPRSPVTVRGTFIAAAKAVLSWAVEEGKLAINVAAQVKVRVPKRTKLRQPDFTADEARAILAATLAPAGPHLSPRHALARRWVPWLCAYTGGRVNEFSQLRGEDVQQVDGIWAIRITPEAGTVKAKEARMVPIHPHLIEQGFLEVVAANGPGPLFYDPAKQRVASDSNRHFKKVGERLAAWVRQDVGITDPNVKPNHGWRHTFKTLSYEAGLEERMVDALQGHAPTSTGRTYGAPSLRAKAEAVAKLPRIDL
jgi:integrase